ncbi:type VII secretion-associated serine protease mycosin [Amycolatopsis sp. WAC 01375]|uniref:type VII secretion-associated serine protease mycosin n=1 Tax=unclassified Amycolatopsis TaxID=2618356 RepID=UPI000F7AD00A|nr:MULTISPECIES: type VII secretion-associated serine protease mycosin [unclassified Amycolatopsis]RSM71161.1 type VII secretion-associated serine protease mycosin [Amycolatopsis sp. WAC 01375]RSN35942.1 type VII secretion-associated serine protease mycosin [Amycolatopsis sp. WAC 01416]
MAVARKSRGTRVRHIGLAGRTGTVLLAAGIGVLSPASVALPAWAQQSSVAADADGYFATPPPVDKSKKPADEGKPDKNYEKKTECVQRSKLGGDQVDIKNRPWGQEYLQIEKVHQLMRGATQSVGGGVKVAVIDTGVTAHPYFGGRVESGGDYVAPPGGGKAPGLEDCDGHGTEVAGIIAANPPDASIGFRGVAPDATILSIRQSSQNYEEAEKKPEPPASSAAPPSSPNNPGSQLPPSSQGNGAVGGTAPGQDKGGRQQEQGKTAGTLKTLAQAVVRAVDKGAQVINMSVDNCRRADGNITLGEQQLQAAVNYAVENNVVVVAAAGNVGEKCPQNDQPDPKSPKMIVTPPWFSDDVLSVAAIDDTGGVADFSVNGPWVSVAAPGTKIISLDPAEGSSSLANLTIEGNGKPGAIQGTSFAAPYVAGLAALVRAKFPGLPARDVMNRIKATAQHPAAPGGRDNFVGFGVVDPIAALTAIVPSEADKAKPVPLPANLPPANDRDPAPMIVALAGTGGGLVALLVTLFVVHSVRRNRPAAPARKTP